MKLPQTNRLNTLNSTVSTFAITTVSNLSNTPVIRRRRRIIMAGRDDI